MEYYILSLDLATNSGWAVGNLNEVHSGTFNVSPKKNQCRYNSLWNELNKLYHGYDFDRVVFERPFGPKGNAQRILHGYEAVLEFWCFDKELDLKSYSPMTIKKHATGTGKATKDMMVDAANKIFPSRNVICDDEADALLLLDMVLKGKG